ncbi:MAG TPA: hemolysin family protein [Longimicrobiales bacterium]|nr:hemolysin family protein [Longimicrobiales bacterium]
MEHEALSVGEIVLRLALAMFLVLANGFFVAAEFALVGARRSRIEALARKGSRLAASAGRAIKDLDHSLSATQLGITLASIGLGFVAEETVARVLIQLFGGLGDPWVLLASHTVAVITALAIITVLHVVLGELAPKSLAILFPERVSMWTAPPLMGFAWVLAPFIYVLNRLANLILRALGLRSPSGSAHVHHPDEIEILAVQSFEHGLMGEEPVDMIRGVFDLSETTAGEAMTPRTEMVAIPAHATVEDATELFMMEGHSRIPVYEGSLDRIVGVLLARDVWKAQLEGAGTIEKVIRPVAFVPDSKTLEQLLREMQSEHTHIAVVVDEFGGTAGIVTLEDLVEEIVGEIQDEYDEEHPEIEETEGGEVLLEGSLPLTELNERFGLALPEDEYTTVAGFIMGKLGRIARQGDRVEFAAGELHVLSMLGRRVKRISLELVPPEGEGAPPE